MRINNSRYKRTVHIWSVIALVCVLGYPAVLTANIKIEDLKQKLADITLLNHQLSDRIAEAKLIREKFRHQKHSMLDEINVLRKKYHFKQFSEADHHLRIHFNLLLIGSIEAYLDRIEEKIIFLENGQNRLIYLQKLASDDIRMIDALNDLEIDALTTQISLVISQYLTEAQVIQLQTSDITPVAPEKIWASIIAQLNIF